MRTSGTVALKPIPGVVGYAAGSDGHVYSFRRQGRGPRYRTTPRKLSGSPSSNKYLTVTVCWLGTTTEYVHRLIALAFHNPIGRDLEVSHLDGNRQNNSPSNLRWETRQENSMRKLGHGTMKIGESHHHAKLTAANAAEILRRSNAGETRGSLASEFGVSLATVSGIANRSTWRHLEDNQ